MKPIPFPKTDPKALSGWVIYTLAAVVVFLFGIYSRSQDSLLQNKVAELEQRRKEIEEYKQQLAELSLKLDKCRDERTELLSQFYLKPGIKTMTITPVNHEKILVE